MFHMASTFHMHFTHLSHTFHTFASGSESGCGIKHSGVCTSRYKEGQGVVGEGGRKDADSCRQGGSS